MPVDTKHRLYDAANTLWDRCLDASEGERVIHAKGIAYLPKLYNEKPEDYEARKKRTPFFNATWRTISGLKGLIFRKKPSVVCPAALEQYLSNVDMSGRPLDLFAQAITEQALKTGRAGILVDHPPMPVDDNGQPVSVAQAEALGMRPYLTLYQAKSIINWRTARVNNVETLVMLVLEETAEVTGEDEFDQKTEQRYRVLDLFDGAYRQRLYRKIDKSQDELISEGFPRMRGKLMTEIPFVFIGVDDLSASIDSPPLLDLVDMNLHHYTVSADYEHGCHFSGLPTLFVTGIQGGGEDTNSPTIYIGGAAANLLPHPECQAFYAETSGNFEGLRQNLDAKKAEMAILGARMLEAQKASVESGDTQKQRVNGEMSVLAAMANIISTAITKSIRIMAEWAGASGNIEYQLNTDFVPEGVSAQEMTALVSAWQSGAISSQVLFDNLKRGEVIGSETTFEEEQERINSRDMVSSMDDMPDTEDDEDDKGFNMDALVAAIAAIPAPVVTVEAPVINLPAPIVNVASNEQSQPAPIVLNTGSGGKVIQFNKDSAGRITGATVTEN